MRSATQKMNAIFGVSDAELRRYFCPGRVCLIGEHIDYCGGTVMTMALEQGVEAHTRLNQSETVRLFSEIGGEVTEVIAGGEIQKPSADDWTIYPRGVLHFLRHRLHASLGLDIYYQSNLPLGSGLSSSAAIETVTAYALLQESALFFDRTDLVRLSKMVENEYVGVNCGMMDQYSVAFGKRDHALLIDCAELSHQTIPLRFGDYRIVVIDSKKPRELADSAYNQRRASCEVALKQINETKELKHLSRGNLNDLELIDDPTQSKRARHVISEQQRVFDSVKLLASGELEAFGKLLNESHQSLKDDFEVSCAELDALVELANEQQSCLGARMTGAGFGGCIIALVEAGRIDEFKAQVTKKYKASFQRECSMIVTAAADGARQIDNE